MYWVLPQYLLKGKDVQFTLIILLWAAAGWFINYLFRTCIFIPIQEFMHYKKILGGGWQPWKFFINGSNGKYYMYDYFI